MHVFWHIILGLNYSYTAIRNKSAETTRVYSINRQNFTIIALRYKMENTQKPKLTICFRCRRLSRRVFLCSTGGTLDLPDVGCFTSWMLSFAGISPCWCNGQRWIGNVYQRRYSSWLKTIFQIIQKHHGLKVFWTDSTFLVEILRRLLH